MSKLVKNFYEFKPDWQFPGNKTSLDWENAVEMAILHLILQILIKGEDVREITHNLLVVG